jgi:hypothetical protein
MRQSGRKKERNMIGRNEVKRHGHGRASTGWFAERKKEKESK